MTATLEAPPFLQEAARRPGRQAPLVVSVPRYAEEQLASAAVEALAEQHPELSAQQVLSRRQVAGLGVVLAALVVGALVSPLVVGRAVAAVLTLVYAAAVSYRLLLTARGMRGEAVIRVTDEEARAVPDADLPVYTVLVPAYREPEVIGDLVRHLEALDYPRDRLDVLVLLEADDADTLEAVRRLDPPEHVRVLVVPEGPAGSPKTKPRACVYGLAFAAGSLVTIYDAEDQPEPLQLRRAAVAFARDPGVACLQARLAYHNAHQNLLTRWFTAEYLSWFTHLLPGLVSVGSPVPLGGTSNHIRTDVLRQTGAWDPFNVTEDADLGIRLARQGHRVGVLDSETLEEANSDVINWVKQRSRWYKGYLQTWLVHVRHPRALHREVGWKGQAGLHLFVGGTPVLAVLNPLLWLTALLWFTLHPAFLAQVFGGPFYYLAMATWVLGTFAVLYAGVLSLREARRPDLLGAVLLVPAYWVLMSLAAAKAAWQLVADPSYWEKTTHGLSAPAPTPVPQPTRTIVLP